jgi:chaperonin GroES
MRPQSVESQFDVRCRAGSFEQPKEVEGPMATETAAATNLKPLGDRVVVKPMRREETTKSGIVIPDTAKEKPQRGRIVAIGQGRRDEDGDRIPLDVSIGDQVLFAKYAGTEFVLDEEDYLILAEKDILAIVTE